MGRTSELKGTQEIKSFVAKINLYHSEIDFSKTLANKLNLNGRAYHTKIRDLKIDEDAVETPSLSINALILNLKDVTLQGNLEVNCPSRDIENYLSLDSIKDEDIEKEEDFLMRLTQSHFSCDLSKITQKGAGATISNVEKVSGIGSILLEDDFDQETLAPIISRHGVPAYNEKGKGLEVDGAVVLKSSQLYAENGTTGKLSIERGKLSSKSISLVNTVINFSKVSAGDIEITGDLILNDQSEIKVTNRCIAPFLKLREGSKITHNSSFTSDIGYNLINSIIIDGYPDEGFLDHKFCAYDDYGVFECSDR